MILISKCLYSRALANTCDWETWKQNHYAIVYKNMQNTYMSEMGKMAYISFRSHLKMAECILIGSKWSIHGYLAWGYVLGLSFINFTTKRPRILFSRAKNAAVKGLRFRYFSRTLTNKLGLQYISIKKCNFSISIWDLVT